MVHTVLGSSWLPAWFLSALTPALQRGQHIYWIDAGNRFDAYGLGRTALWRAFPRLCFTGDSLFAIAERRTGAVR